MFAAVVCVFCLVGCLCRRQVCRLRPRLRRGTLCRFADDLGVDGPCDRCDQPPRPAAGRNQEAAGCDAGRLRRHLHFRHGRIGRHYCAAGPGSLRHRSRGRLQALRGEARRQEGRRAVPARPGTNSSCARSASGTGDRSWARRRRRPKRCCPSSGCSSSASDVAAQIMDATADTVIQAGDVVAVAGRRDVLVNLIGAGGRRSRRSRAAGGAGGRRRCLRDQQGGRRKDARRTGQISRARAACSCARSRAARPRPTSRFCRTRSCTGATSSPSSDAPRTSRQRPRCWAIRTARPTWPMWRLSVRQSRSARWSARSSTRSAACRSRCPPPAAR